MFLLAVRERPVGDRRNQCGILAFYRYRDDIFVILRDDISVVGDWFTSFKRRALPYKLELEKLSRKVVPFLDVEISLKFDGYHSTLAITPYRKPTSCRIPLASDSAHHPSVHVPWPCAEIKRLLNNSSDIRIHPQVVHNFKCELLRSGHSPALIDYVFSRHAEAKRKQTSNSNALWFVTRFHPQFAKIIPIALNKLAKDAALLQIAFGEVALPSLHLAWRSACPGMLHLVKQI